MAEGWMRQLGGNDLNVKSAGIEAHGQNPRAISTMAEAGVDIAGQQSSQFDAAMLDWADYVVTVCGHADEQCPILPAGTRKEHWPLPDPAQAAGTEEEISAAFRESRDDIRHRVADMIERLRIEQGL
jgi:arsenate reductase